MGRQIHLTGFLLMTLFFISLGFCFAQDAISDANKGTGVKPFNFIDKKPIEEPEFETDDASPAPKFELPPVEIPDADPGKEQNISNALLIYVDSYRFEGNTAVPDQELSAVARPFTKRKISNAELHELRNRLTRLYIEKGYITSGAILPDQKVINGIITFKLIEGRVTRINIDGNTHLADGFIQSRLALGVAQPLQARALQEQIRILHQNPDIRKLDVYIKPGLNLGENELDATIYESKLYGYGFEFNNCRSPNVGSYQGELFGEYHGITGWGDAIGANIELTEGLNNYSAFFRIPVTSRDTEFELQYKRNDALMVEKPFNVIDIESKSDTIHLSVKHPFLKTRKTGLSGSIIFEHYSSRTYLMGSPYSFSAGVEDGKSSGSPFRLAVDYRRQSLNQVIALRSTFSLGTNWFNATEHHDLPDSEFFSWLGQFQWARRFEKLKNSQIVFRADAQLTNDELLPMEKFPVGGANSVRGYRENQLVRDQGAATSIELRIPLIRFDIPGVSASLSDGIIHGAVFYDMGWSDHKSETMAENEEIIHSAGLGLRWAPSANIQTQVYWGYAFNDFESSDYDLQDSGIHFQVRCAY